MKTPSAIPPAGSDQRFFAPPGTDIRHTLIVDPDDFDDATQKELCVIHMQAVAQRKEAEKIATLERQRMEEILNICAEYEAQEKGDKPQARTGPSPQSGNFSTPEMPKTPVKQVDEQKAVIPKREPQHYSTKSVGDRRQSQQKLIRIQCRHQSYG